MARLTVQQHQYGHVLILYHGGPIMGECCCAPVTCDNGWPPLKVTLTWPGPPATRTFLGLTWTSGQTQKVCPTTYWCQQSCQTTTGSTYYTCRTREGWFAQFFYSGTAAFFRSIAMLNRRSYGRNVSTYIGYPIYRSINEGARVKVAYKDFQFGSGSLERRISLRNYRTKGYFLWFTTTSNAYSWTLSHYISTQWAAASALGPYLVDPRVIPDVMFGQVTYQDGMSIKWERYRLSQWNTCAIV